MAQGKSLTVEQNRRVRAAVREKLLPPHKGNVTALASELGISQAGLSAFLSEKNGAGMQLSTAVAQRLGMTRDELLDGVRRESDGEGPQVSNLIGWPEAEAKARQFSSHPPAVWEQTRRKRGFGPPGGIVTAEWVLNLANFVAGNPPLEEQLAREDRKLDAQMKAIQTRAENKLAKARADDDAARAKAAAIEQEELYGDRKPAPVHSIDRSGKAPAVTRAAKRRKRG